MFSDNINGVVRYDFAQNPSVWFIMNSINAKKPNDGFLCGTDVCNQHRTVRERDMQEKKKNTKSGFSILG